MVKPTIIYRVGLVSETPELGTQVAHDNTPNVLDDSFWEPQMVSWSCSAIC